MKTNPPAGYCSGSLIRIFKDLGRVVAVTRQLYWWSPVLETYFSQLLLRDLSGLHGLQRSRLLRSKYAKIVDFFKVIT